jgi:hypothetical protein
MILSEMLKAIGNTIYIIIIFFLYQAERGGLKKFL